MDAFSGRSTGLLNVFTTKFKGSHLVKDASKTTCGGSGLLLKSVQLHGSASSCFPKRRTADQPFLSQDLICS